MTDSQRVLEYKCPCCDAGLKFSGAEQKLVCEYCDNTFDLETIKEYNKTYNAASNEDFEWDDAASPEWTEEEQANMSSFICETCGGEIVGDSTMAATFCPYCENPTIIRGRLSGGLRPDGVIPFKTTKEDAKEAFLRLCKGKPLLPKLFTKESRLEKITGLYVPFWLYDCSADLDGQYKATRVRRWSDSQYNYTKTDYYMLSRSARADFIGIPMDGSTKMDDTVMESIEPFDLSAAVDFETAYLSGFLADKYDVEAAAGEPRVRQRVDATMDDMIRQSFSGYSSVTTTSKNLQVKHSKARYVLLPVWMLNTKYKDKVYTFAMNGQTRKMTGTLPIDKGRMWAWFFGLFGGISVGTFALFHLAIWLIT